MANYKLTFCYDGTRYRGWQNQNNVTNTIQHKMEMVLSDILHEPTSLQASGRTDAGVHAHMQVANFHSSQDLETDKILSQLRHQLPQDIGALILEKAPDDFHARLNCTGKTYRYYLWNSEDPCIFQRRYRTVLTEPLNLVAMQKAATLFLGTHDFSAFTSSRNKKHSSVRTIREITIRKEGPEIIMEYSADGFLYNMVRILTGSLIEVGLGEKTKEDLIDALESRIRADAGFTAPPQGLFLWNVEY
jgi:tRNA pseudouridine38-40 synthase